MEIHEEIIELVTQMRQILAEVDRLLKEAKNERRPNQPTIE